MNLTPNTVHVPRTIEDARLLVATYRGRVEEARRQVENLDTEILNIESTLPAQRDAVLLAKKCLDQCLAMRSKIEEIVREGLRTLFLEDLDFMLEPVYGDDNTVKGLRPRIRTANGEFSDPKDDYSAGVLSTASFFLHIGIVLISGKTERLLVFDEPLPTLNVALWHRLEGLLQEICATTGLQVIIVTHFPHTFGKTYRVVMRTKGTIETSYVERVERRSDQVPLGEDPWVVVPETD